ncbi:hypothetical protein [Vibrio cholerae]|uniref:hypothetical protein n=1 Tax=Vibrio cholerae TaxID=666 RepID=UPI0028DA1435|nr:hypothetical protein [Vibrio cholerae]ELJ8720565.1 hypothetical protein [Vibrio cholerae]MDV2354575.1 hypothetical protein [Vibrio cholerae]
MELSIVELLLQLNHSFTLANHPLSRMNLHGFIISTTSELLAFNRINRFSGIYLYKVELGGVGVNVGVDKKPKAKIYTLGF